MKQVRRLRRKALGSLENLSIRLTGWIGTPTSIIFHSIVFAGIFSLQFFGVGFETVLLILTTGLSIEAIYLAIFIQMTVNRQQTAIEAVEEDIEDIAEDVEEDNQVDAEVTRALKTIEGRLGKLQTDLEVLKKKGLL